MLEDVQNGRPARAPMSSSSLHTLGKSLAKFAKGSVSEKVSTKRHGCARIGECTGSGHPTPPTLRTRHAFGSGSADRPRRRGLAASTVSFRWRFSFGGVGVNLGRDARSIDERRHQASALVSNTDGARSPIHARRSWFVSPLACDFVRARDRMDQCAMRAENNAVAAADQSGI